MLYDPANPADARLPGGAGRGLIQGVFIALGTIFAVVGLLLVAVWVAVA